MEEIKRKQEYSGQKSVIKIAIIFFILIAAFFGIKKYYDNGCRGYRPYWYNPYYCTDTQDWYRGGQDQITGSNLGPAAELTQIDGDQSSGVEVTAVYEKEKSQTQTFFKLYFNTHTVDFSGYDFQENVAIKDSQGKEHKAADIAEEGAGHHQSIEIAFPLAASPFKLVIKNLAGVPAREFNW